MIVTSTKSFFHVRNLAALLALSLATACQPPEPDDTEDTLARPAPEPEAISVRLERSGDALRFSWGEGEVHRFEVVQCAEPLPQEPLSCRCDGALVWSLGPGESEKFHEVAREAPFIASPVEYGVTPGSDRRGYAARPLVTGRTYIVNATRVGPCEENPQDCQQTTARGCLHFVW
jgi:hypothetical protein